MYNILEVCTGSVESVVSARNGGAQRAELCAALEIGGVTPSAGLISEARKIEGIALHVLIRPRGGDFLYDKEETACMVNDIMTAKELGANGVVIGALTAEGEVDIAVCQQLTEAAQGMNITFHRAFDMCRDPFAALEQIISLGCNRILTSGQAATAEHGIELLKKLVEKAEGRISIMPGCGVNAGNAAKILHASGAHEIHASARANVGSRMLYRHNGVSMGNTDNDEFARKETDPKEVKRIIEAINF